MQPPQRLKRLRRSQMPCPLSPAIRSNATNGRLGIALRKKKCAKRTDQMSKNALLLVLLSFVALGVAPTAKAQQTPKVAGNWTVKIHSTTEGILEQQWSIK